MARTPGIFAASSRLEAGIRIIAADDHVAVDRTFGVQQFGSDVVKSGHDRDTFRNEFCSLLRSGALPDAECAGRATAHARGQGYRGVNDDAAGTNRRFELLQQRCVAFERDGQHQQVRGGACGGIFVAGNLSVRADLFVLSFPRRLGHALRLAIR